MVRYTYYIINFLLLLIFEYEEIGRFNDSRKLARYVTATFRVKNSRITTGVHLSLVNNTHQRPLLDAWRRSTRSNGPKIF